VACIKFDPSCKWLISVGFKEDKFINVWDWKEKSIVATNKTTAKIYAIDFPEDGSHFVTCGSKYLKFWYHVDSQGAIRQTEKTYKVVRTVRFPLMRPEPSGIGGEISDSGRQAQGVHVHGRVLRKGPQRKVSFYCDSGWVSHSN
jgi:WD40 repeat protein